MVDADEETALLSAARDAAGREEPPRRRGRVIAVLVLVGALALAAAGRDAADSETNKGLGNGVGGGSGHSLTQSSKCVAESADPAGLGDGDRFIKGEKFDTGFSNAKNAVNGHLYAG